MGCDSCDTPDSNQHKTKNVMLLARSNSFSYSNKIILAPMVRVGTLPLRLLSLDYGADLVYTEELIDFRLLKCQRIENRILGTVDFVGDDQVVFRTCRNEQGKVVLQLGTCDPERAVQVAKLVERDVVGIDVNMGCPKEFSIKGGMGAALLTNPEKVKEILTSLVKNISCPITCKIRILPSVEETVNLAKLIESTGVSAIAVHGRTKEERPRHKNRNYVIKAVVDAVKIPVIANGGSGEINSYEDILRFKKETGASSVMLARQAEWNCSIFRRAGKLPIDTVITSYLKYAIDYDNNAINTKYCIQQMLGSLQDTDRGRLLLNSQLMDEICKLWDMSDYYQKKQLEFENATEKLKKLHNRDSESPFLLKRRKVGDRDIWEMEIRFINRLFQTTELPKTLLWNYTRKYCLPKPCYQTEQIDKSFQSVVTVAGKKYSNICTEKNKKMAEQAAALVAAYVLELVDNSKIKTMSFSTTINDICCALSKSGAVNKCASKTVAPDSEDNSFNRGSCSDNFYVNETADTEHSDAIPSKNKNR